MTINQACGFWGTYIPVSSSMEALLQGRRKRGAGGAAAPPKIYKGGGGEIAFGPPKNH